MVVQETGIAQKSSKRIPINFTNESLDKEVDKLYKESQCSADAKQEQDDFINCISSCVHAVSVQFGGSWHIFPFGSAVWGLQTNESDIDLAIDMKQSNVSRQTRQEILRNIKKKVEENERFVVKDVTFVRYPIIKINDTLHGIDMDLSVADKYCLRTTQYVLSLINGYEQFGIPVRKFIVLIKDWSKKNEINNSMHSYPNSFGYTLMALHFIHCLMNNYKNAEIVFEQKVESFGCICKILQKISNLVAGFFAFYGWTFDPHLHRIDITQTELLCRRFGQAEGQTVGSDG